LYKRFGYSLGIIVFGFFTLLAVLATLLPLSPSKEWYIRIFDYPRLQTFVIAVIALIWFIIFYFNRSVRHWLFAGLLSVVIIVQAYKAWPYTPLGKKEVLQSKAVAGDQLSISLLISNVLQTNKKYHLLINKIKNYDPDILITTETDSTWQKQLEVIEKKYPNKVSVPLSNLYGMHLYSRLPLEGSQIRYLVEPDIPSIYTKVQLRNGEWITLYIVHPRPPVPGESSDSKERDAEIIMVGREAKKDEGGVIVAGDLNDVAWSENTELFQEVSGLLDPRRGRGFFNTYHSKVPIFRWPLDHIFHSNHFKLIKMERGGSVNSDHFPMFVHLNYEPENKNQQPQTKPDSNTAEDASETIREGKNDADENN
jgi:endonuclease/exonuclease/phosphatase (EEP) superfamily protein YafD